MLMSKNDTDVTFLARFAYLEYNRVIIKDDLQNNGYVCWYIIFAGQSRAFIERHLYRPHCVRHESPSGIELIVTSFSMGFMKFALYGTSITLALCRIHIRRVLCSTERVSKPANPPLFKGVRNFGGVLLHYTLTSIVF